MVSLEFQSNISLLLPYSNLVFCSADTLPVSMPTTDAS